MASQNLDPVRTTIHAIATLSPTTAPIQSAETEPSSFNLVQFIKQDIWISILSIVIGLLCITALILYYKQKRRRSKDLSGVYRVGNPRNQDGVVNINMANDMVPHKSASMEPNICKEDDANASLQQNNNLDDINIDTSAIKEWLTNEVKLPQYYRIFVENGYDNIDFIRDITSKFDLQDIGITKMGHQVRILAQIQKLKDLEKSSAYDARSARTGTYTQSIFESKYEELDEEERAIKRKALNPMIPIDEVQSEQIHNGVESELSSVMDLPLPPDQSQLLSVENQLLSVENIEFDHERIKSDPSILSVAAMKQYDTNAGMATDGFMMEDESDDEESDDRMKRTTASPTNDSIQNANGMVEKI